MKLMLTEVENEQDAQGWKENNKKKKDYLACFKFSFLKKQNLDYKTANKSDQIVFHPHKKDV